MSDLLVRQVVGAVLERSSLCFHERTSDEEAESPPLVLAVRYRFEIRRGVRREKALPELLWQAQAAVFETNAYRWCLVDINMHGRLDVGRVFDRTTGEPEKNPVTRRLKKVRPSYRRALAHNLQARRSA